MTRTLPWLNTPRPGTPQATPSPRNSTPRVKRRRIVAPSSDLDDDNGGETWGEKNLNVQSSPPLILGPPSESSMDEGLDKDDRFRMVEDEFLDMAKQFTQHLHAAEYQRMKKAARSQNAAVINSISRPVSVRMPDETRRKVESVARAKKQAAAVHSLVKKQGHGSGSDEDSDGNGGPWLGTALHGLMESPRKSVASLAKIGKATSSARAAFGFDKTQPPKPFKSFPSPSPDLGSFETTKTEAWPRKGDSREFSNDDDDGDDLDAPIKSRSPMMSNGLMKFEITPSSRVVKQELRHKPSKISKPSTIGSFSMVADEDIDDKSSGVSINARERIAKRLEQSRLRRVTEEQEARKKVGVIPMFLS